MNTAGGGNTASGSVGSGSGNTGKMRKASGFGA
jgi:hypothetical protein